jgi:hypothetical protein
MEFDDFVRLILTTWPDAIIDENQYGELVVLTNHRLDKNNKLVRLEHDESF